MTQKLKPQELALVLAAQNHNALMFNFETLKLAGVIPTDWQIAREPLFSNQASQIIFQNGVNLVAQGNQIVFAETLNDKTTQEVAIAEVARKYIEILPHAGYQAIGINVRAYVPFDEADAATQFLTKTLLAGGAWQQFGQQTAKAAINLAYSLEGRRLLLSINEATLKMPEDQSMPVILFSGNFEYRFDAQTESDRTAQLQQVLQNWQADFEAYQTLIDTRFLGNPASSTWLPETSEPELVPVGA